MLHVTGIGTYIRHVVPRVIASWKEARFTLLGDVPALRKVITDTRVALRAFDAPIYSLAEQLTFPRLVPKNSTLFWSPHYNIPLLHRGPLAVTVHDLIHLAFPATSLVKRAYARGMFAEVRRRSTVVLCDSNFAAADFRARVGEPRALVVAPLGVDARWFQLEQRDAPVGVPYFLYVGNVKRHKNLGRLIEAFARVATRLPHTLVVIGPSDGLLTVDDTVAGAAAALGGRVTLTGHVGHESLESYVANCDALVLPSLYEGFGLPPLEALAAGRAVGVARAGSLPEVCGPEADYFDPLDVDSIADCLIRLASRPRDTPACWERRQSWARRFQWDQCALTTEAALRRAVSGKAHSAMSSDTGLTSVA